MEIYTFGHKHISRAISNQNKVVQINTVHLSMSDRFNVLDHSEAQRAGRVPQEVHTS